MVKKGSIIINPKTSSPVKVGGRTWLKLVKEGLLEGVYEDSNELYELLDDEKDGDTPFNYDEKIEEINKDLPRGIQAVKGRGKYKNKIVKRKKVPSVLDVQEWTSKIASQAIKDNLDSLDPDKDIGEQLEQIIYNELIKGSYDQCSSTPNEIPNIGEGKVTKLNVKVRGVNSRRVMKGSSSYKNEALYKTTEAPEFDEPSESEPDQVVEEEPEEEPEDEWSNW